MSRIFVTGDKHGSFSQMQSKLYKCGADNNDVVIILGDHGTLYYGKHGDKRKKMYLSELPATFICIRGNHDRRPDCEQYEHELKYYSTPEYTGYFYVDPEYPNILYTKEYGWYRFGTKKVFVIGGAYSIDKYHRLKMQANGLKQYLWFSDEQLDFNEREQAAKALMFAAQSGTHCIMSHTAPLRYKPFEALLPGIDQSTVDESMEIWLDAIYDDANHDAWYCGHWHIDKTIDKMCFLYNDIILFDEINDNNDANN